VVRLELEGEVVEVDCAEPREGIRAFGVLYSLLRERGREGGKEI
jgi:hypothetical protein